MIEYIIDFLGELGLRYTRDELLKIYDYLKAMLDDGRILLIFEDGIPIAFCAFSLCNDYIPYSEKDIWYYLSQEPMGRIVFIEKLASKKWDRQIRNLIEREIVSKYPSIRDGIWYRPGLDDDRIIKTNRRINAEDKNVYN